MLWYGAITAFGTMRLNSANCGFRFLASIKSSQYRFMVYAVSARQVLCCKHNSIYRYLQNSLTSVQSLRTCISPSAVVWCIRTAWINSVKRIADVWCSSHIRQERGEIIAPAIAHNNTLCTVSMKPAMCRIMASSLRVFPRRPFLCSASINGIAVRFKPFAGQFTAKATTTLRAAISKTRCLNNALCSTFTLA